MRLSPCDCHIHCAPTVASDVLCLLGAATVTGCAVRLRWNNVRDAKLRAMLLPNIVLAVTEPHLHQPMGYNDTSHCDCKSCMHLDRVAERKRDVERERVCVSHFRLKSPSTSQPMLSQMVMLVDQSCEHVCAGS